MSENTAESAINVKELLEMAMCHEKPDPKIIESFLKFNQEQLQCSKKSQFLKALCDFQKNHGELESDNVVSYTDPQTHQPAEFVMPPINHVKTHILENAGKYGLVFTVSTSVSDPDARDRFNVELTIGHIAGYTKTYSRECVVTLPPKLDYASEVAAAISKYEKMLLIKAFGISVKAIREDGSGQTVYLEDFVVQYPVSSNSALKESHAEDETEENDQLINNSGINKINKKAASLGVDIKAVESHLKVIGYIRSELTELRQDQVPEVEKEIVKLKNQKPLVSIQK